MKRFYLALQMLSLAASFNCQAAEAPSPASTNCEPLYASFFAEPNATKRQEEFRRLDLDQQFVVYLCGNQKMHPPTIYLAETFAEQGGKIVPFLAEKLATANTDSTIRDIVDVFAWMARLKTYDVASDTSLMKLMENRSLDVKNDIWRKATAREIDGIRLRPMK